MDEDLIASAKRVAAQRAYGSIYSSQYGDAIKSGKANELATRMGLPADIVEADYPNMMAEDRLRKRNAQIQQNAAYARIMANNRLAASAIDDDHLPDVAQHADTLANAPAPTKGGFMAAFAKADNYTTKGLVSGLYSTAASAADLFSGLGNIPGQVSALGGVIAAGVRDPFGTTSAPREAYGQYLAAGSRSNSVSHFAEDMQRKSQTADAPTPGYSDLVYGTTDASKSAFLSPVRLLHDLVQSAPSSAVMIVGGVLSRGASVAASGEAYAAAIAKGIEESVAKAIGKKAGTMAAMRVGGLVGAGGEGVLGGLQQRVQTRTEVLDKPNLDDSPVYQDMIAAGVSPEDARQYVATQAGDIAGAGAGIVDAGVNLIGGRILGKIISEGGSLLARGAKGFADEALTEGAQGFGEQLSQNAAMQGSVDPHQALMEGVVENVLASFAVGGLMGGVTAGVAGHGMEVAQDLKAGQMVNALVDSAAKSSTRASNPTHFTEALNQLVGDTTAEHMYIPVEQIDALASDDPFWAKYQTQIDDAHVLGGDVIIPTADAVTYLAGVPAEWAALKDHVRMSPKGSSITEAQNKQSPEALEKMAADVASHIESRVNTNVRDKILNILNDDSHWANDPNRDPVQQRLHNQTLAAATAQAYQNQLRISAEQGTPAPSIEQYVEKFAPQIERVAQAHYEARAGGAFNQVVAPTVVGQVESDNNKNGLMPHLRVAVSNFVGKRKALFSQKTNNKSAPKMLAALDEIAGLHPQATSSPEAWTAMLADALGDADVPVPPYAFIQNINGDGSINLLSQLSPGQIADADHGFANAAEFRRAYVNGEISIEDTGRLFLWSFLSRGVSPYTQEGLFIDSFDGIGQWITAAADGTLKDRLSEYAAWAATAAPKGSGQPGAGAAHNLNAFGKLFLVKMSEDSGDGRSRLQVLHDMMSDPTTTGRQVRRKFMEMGEGVGIDNKVVSFTLLVAGYDDVLVLDRVQIREMWNDGRFDGINLYDGYKQDGVPVAGSALSSLTYGARGLLVYEAAERGLEAQLDRIYGALGRPEAASVGRYHWETWVASSNQEASHATLDAILAAAKGEPSPMDGVEAKEGEYGNYAYGARYGRGSNGESYFIYSVPGVADFRFSVEDFRQFLTDIKKPANGVVPTKFKVTESGNAPWYQREGVSLDALAKLADQHGQRFRADEVSGTNATNGEDPAVPDRPSAYQSSGLADTFNQLTPNERIFYSAAQQVVETAKQERASAGQWKALLTPGKTPGIKAEEIEWTGIHDWLDMQTGPVEKSALLQFLKDKGIHVEEVILSGDDLRFDSWTSHPGDPSNREILITLPIGSRGNPTRAPSTHWDTDAVVAHTRVFDAVDTDGKKVLVVDENQSDWHQKGRDQGYQKTVTLAELEALGQANRDAMLIAGGAINDFLNAAEELRLELVKIKRAKNLSNPTDEVSQIGPVLAYQKIARGETILARAIGVDAVAETYAKVVDAKQAMEAATLRQNETSQAAADAQFGTGIPNAPFKSSWPALVMKRLIIKAAREGYDRIAWTTGEEQASRYNLSSAVGSLTLEGVEDSSGYRVRMDSAAAAQLVTNELGSHRESLGEAGKTSVRMTENQMREAFGNDITKRLLESDGETLRDTDLKIGGEGMKAFYDRNLVNITNDIIKKYGGKVGQINLPSAAKGLDLDRIRANIEEDRQTIAQMEANRRDASDDAAIAFARQGMANREKLITQMRPGFDITDKMREAATQGMPLFQQKRGNIEFARNDQGMMEGALIRAFEAENFSTMLHELGHYYLENIRNQALSPHATPQQKADWESYKSWVKNTLNIDVTDDTPIQRDAHELFARGIETYHYEGKAPSKELRGLFAQVSALMKRIYKMAKDLNAPITPEIREVMDRIFASDLEIKEQRKDIAAAEDAMSGLMTGEEKAQYDALTGEARDGEREKLYARILSTLKREKTAEAKARKEEIGSEVTDAIDQQPINRAIKMIRVGVRQDDGSFAKVRISREWLTDIYGEDAESKMPGGVPPLVSNNDTMDADQIATDNGFSSGDEMIKAMMAQEAQRLQQKAGGDKRSVRQTQIEDAVDKQYREELGDPFANLEEEAMAMMADDRQADVLSMELRAVARKTGGKPTPWKAAVEFARRHIPTQTTKDALSGTSLQLYSRNANKAANAFTEALVKGDLPAAFAAKQRQLLNLALLQEAKRFKEDVTNAARRMEKIDSKDTMPSVDQDYLEIAHQLLEDVNLSKRPPSKRERRFAAWHKQQVDMGVEPIVPPQYSENLSTTHWADMNVAQFLELNEAVGQIIQLGRLKQKLMDGKLERDFDEAVSELQGQAEMQRQRKQTAANDPNRTMSGKIKSRLRGIDAAMLKVEQMVDWLDGEDSNGPWNRLVFGVMSRAQGREDDLKHEYVTKINDLIKGMGKAQLKGLGRAVDTPELINNVRGHPNRGQPFQFDKDQIVMMAMNWGNDGNRQRLVDGFGWNEQVVQQVFDRLMTKEDWDFVQGVWDTVNGLWPDLAALERRVNGVAPEKVEATEVSTPHGVYNGGYFPAVYDTTYSTKAQLDEYAKLSPGGAYISTRASSAKARSEAVKGRPLLLNMSVITRHLGEVIHDITHREAVNQVRKILADPRVRTAVDGAMGPEYVKAMDGWIENIATPNMADSKENATLVGIARHLNKGVSLVGLGFRLSTILQQPLGMANMTASLGEKWMGKGLAIATAHPIRTYHEVVARSAEMRNRFSTLDANIEDMVNEAQSGALKTIGPKGIIKHAFDGILYADMLITTAGWIGGFNRGLSEGMNEDEAAYYADKVIRNSQGAGGQKDRSGILRASQFARTFWPFFSYMNALYNQQRDVGHKLRRGEYAEAARRGWWVVIVPAMLQALLFGNGPPDDEDQSDPEVWAKWLVLQVTLGNLGSIPGVNAIASAIGSGYGYRSNAWQGIGEGIKKGWEDTDRAIHGEGIKGASVKGVATTLGIVFAKPVGQIATAAGGIIDYEKGNAHPEDIGDWYELLTRGRTSKTPTPVERALGE